MATEERLYREVDALIERGMLSIASTHADLQTAYNTLCDTAKVNLRRWGDCDDSIDFERRQDLERTASNLLFGHPHWPDDDVDRATREIMARLGITASDVPAAVALEGAPDAAQLLRFHAWVGEQCWRRPALGLVIAMTRAHGTAWARRLGRAEWYAYEHLLAAGIAAADAPALYRLLRHAGYEETAQMGEDAPRLAALLAGQGAEKVEAWIEPFKRRQKRQRAPWHPPAHFWEDGRWRWTGSETSIVRVRTLEIIARKPSLARDNAFAAVAPYLTDAILACAIERVRWDAWSNVPPPLRAALISGVTPVTLGDGVLSAPEAHTWLNSLTPDMLPSVYNLEARSITESTLFPATWLAEQLQIPLSLFSRLRTQERAVLEWLAHKRTSQALLRKRVLRAPDGREITYQLVNRLDEVRVADLNGNPRRRVDAVLAAAATRLARERPNRGGAFPVFRQIEAMPEIVQLRTAAALTEEGDRMSHCVGSYTTWCQKGESFVFSVRASADERSTIEVIRRDGRWVIAQHQGYHRSAPPEACVRLVRLWAAKNLGRAAA